MLEKFPHSLQCPSCFATLREQDGQLICSACRSDFGIDGGIPRLLTRSDQVALQTMRESYEVQWGPFLKAVEKTDNYHFNTWQEIDGQRVHAAEFVRNVAKNSQWIDLFLRDADLPVNFFSGKLCLDAGCGFGRYAYALLELEADLTAIDLTSACVEQLTEEFRDYPDFRAVQANVSRLPFPDATFDYVLCWGVLMLLRDPRPALRELVRVLKPGRQLTLHFYEFVNPLRIANMWLIRRFVQLLPPWRRMLVTDRFIMRPAHRWTPYWYWRKLVTAFIEVSDSRIGAFDSISPPVVKRYTDSRVRRELQQCGIRDVRFSTPRTPRAPLYPLFEPLSRWLHGRYGGSFVLTGTKSEPPA